ncbi:MAG: PEP-CTERM sorting domain-containing protein [Nibricoccus sp.]
MKTKLTSLIILAAALATGSHAQITLHNFSNFESPQTLFFGDWSDSGDPFAGSTTPSPLLSQDAGSFLINGATNADTSYVEYTFASTQDLTFSGKFSLKLRLLEANTADSLTVFLLDTSARTAFATFQMSDFNLFSFSERSEAFTADAGFDISEVSAFRISGNDPFGDSFSGPFLGVALDNLGIVPVPEPSTYGLIGAGVLLLVIAIRRRRVV